MVERSQFRILWMSNAPFAPTGYGTVTNNVCYRLLKQGFKVATVNYWGHEGTTLHLNGLRQYPRGFENQGQDALRFAIDDYKPHVVVPLFDIWVTRPWAEGKGIGGMHPRTCIYSPVDHEPLMPANIDVLRNAYRVVAMSEFAKRMYEEADIDCTLIPHGVDTQVFKPENKQNCKLFADELSRADAYSMMPEGADTLQDKFIVGVNAANKGDRKDFQRIMKAFKIFLENNPDARKDARLYLNTWIRGIPEGLQLDELAQAIGILPYVRWTPIIKMWAGLPTESMNLLYNSYDVLINLAMGGGFELALIEAQACGVPCIATDFSSMTELVKGSGWLIPVKDRHYTPLNAEQVIADEYKAADAIEDAYSHPDKRAKNAKISHFKATHLYDYEQCILPAWCSFFDEIRGYLTQREELYATSKANLAKIGAVIP